MVQSPAATIVTVDPETVHTLVVVDVNVTVKFELAVALTENAASLYVLSPNAPKLMVCEACEMVTVPATYVMS